MRRNSRGKRRLDQVLAVTGTAVAAGALAGVKFVGGWAQFLVICLLAAGTGLGAYSGNSLRARAAGTPPQVLISHPHGDEPWAHWLAWRLRRIGYLTSTRPWAPAEQLVPPPRRSPLIMNSSLCPGRWTTRLTRPSTRGWPALAASPYSPW